MKQRPERLFKPLQATTSMAEAESQQQAIKTVLKPKEELVQQQVKEAIQGYEQNIITKEGAIYLINQVKKDVGEVLFKIWTKEIERDIDDFLGKNDI